MANRRFAGVAAGLSDFLGFDVWLIRLFFILGTGFTGGIGFVIYIVLWLIVPEDSSNKALGIRPQRGPSWILVVIAIIISIGIISDHSRGSAIVPVLVLVAALTFLIVKGRHRTSWRTRKEFEKARLAWQRRLDERSGQANTTTFLGGDSFQIGSFYSEQPPNNDDAQNPPTGFQIQ